LLLSLHSLFPLAARRKSRSPLKLRLPLLLPPLKPSPLKPLPLLLTPPSPLKLLRLLTLPSPLKLLLPRLVRPPKTLLPPLLPTPKRSNLLSSDEKANLRVGFFASARSRISHPAPDAKTPGFPGVFCRAKATRPAIT
jgi:hypothetical protein